jgi:tetratricopeptide (TPR) repeat protein
MITAAFLVALTAFVPFEPQLVPPAAASGEEASDEAVALDEAQRLFYNGRYDAADALTLKFCTADLEGLAGCEVRSSTLLFEIKRAVSGRGDVSKAFKTCERCADWLSAFKALTLSAQGIARAQLKAVPSDDNTRFLLGKIDLNYVWLQLGVLGHKTGWAEYWEARKSLDAVLKQNPRNIRAQVARAWIDYIVDTQMPRGTRWVLGGGNKKRGLAMVREAAAIDSDPFIRAEAGFALWDMQQREANIPAAVETARMLARDFPENEELRKFLAAHESRTTD